MSDLQQPASLLDGLILGEPISNHHGVRCCPAICESNDDKYIIKIISLPESQSKLDALIFTGACSDEAQALAYFKELADGIVSEAEILHQLGQLEGFMGPVSFESREMHNGVGYQVFLKSNYTPSLSRLMLEQPLTHLAAVNLGLDLCAALTASRRLGYLYVDLRPENIFYCENKGYRIGDLGFIPMGSLKYASLPERYRSCYTAPEVHDALSTLSDTMDIYALGLVLYQIFNNGQLPFEGNAPVKPFPTPLYADYEMAEIILKACAPEPKDRWQDPAQMGQALVDYMQRNSVNATPIIPAPVVIDEPAQEDTDFLTDEENNAELAELLAALPEELPPVQLAMDGSMLPLIRPQQEEPQEVPEEHPQEADPEQLTFLVTQTDEETGLTVEVVQMLALADDLIAHQLPEPVVAPGPIDVELPPVVAEDAEEAEDAEPDIILPHVEVEPAEEEPQPVNYDTEDEYLYNLPVRRPRKWIAIVTTVVLLLSAIIGGYIWYHNFFVQKVNSMTVQGSGNEITITIVSEIDEKLLTAICTDSYGNTLRSPVSGGVARFTNLTPGTLYRIRLEISGLHKLVGSTTGIYTTDNQTTITSFTATCGNEDGSVILTISHSGPDSNQWTMIASATGEEDRIQTFSGHKVTMNGLTPGKLYTFRLSADGDMPLAGQTELQYTAQKIITAQDLQVTACGGGSMSIAWTQPDAPSGQIWYLRCYNDAGYDQTVSTTEYLYTFTGLDHSTGYTVTVMADGMPQSVSTSISANPINITAYTATAMTPYAFTLSWEYTGTAPKDGWVLRYSINNSDEFHVSCPSNEIFLTLISDATYEFTVIPADNVTYFTQSYIYTAPTVTPFEGYGITAENIKPSLVLRPDSDQWSIEDLTDDSYKTVFRAEEKAAILLNVATDFSLSEDAMNIVFVIRDNAAQLISAEQYNTSWQALWKESNCLLDLPQMPNQSGEYYLDLYFNDAMVVTLPFTVL